jgi:hypothetical protein
MSAASVFALAALLLTMLAGATDVARDYAALLEAQVREQLWSALLSNPLAWVCFTFVAAIAVVAMSLPGYVLLLLHRSVRDRGESGP